MKNSRLLFVLLVLGTVALNAQTVTLTFTGRDGANRYLKLNRVVITNLTRSWQETIWYPDTTLTMTNNVGVQGYNIEKGFRLSQNTPNPFSRTTDVTLTVSEEGAVNLDIADVNGRIVEKQNLATLYPGKHQFQISLSRPGTYVMTARQNGKTSSIKMLCNGGGETNAIDYFGEMQSLTCVLKSNTNKPFHFGDQMEYVGYATINGTEEESQRITNTQGSSQSFTLQFSGVQIQYELPTVNTSTVSGITYTSATCGGYVSSNGGTNVTARGVCWSTSQNPTISNSHTNDGTGIGSFNSDITGLIGGTTYYVRAYATNSVGTAYGAQRTFTTPADLPTVTTGEISNVTSTTATCGGNVTSNGGVPVTARGLCWSTSQNPTVSGNHTTNGSGTGTFTSNITGLTANTVYFVRAYATNSVGTAYGEQRQFAAAGGGNDGQPCPMATVTDYDGNIYNTVQIGNQCWMKENLKTTHFPNGTSIPLGETISNTSPFRCEPYSSGEWPTGFFVNTYGYLYNWAAATYGAYGGIPNIQGACPDGWHLPSDSEWIQLTDYVSCHSQYLCSNQDNTVNIAKALSSTTGEFLYGHGQYGWKTSSNPCSIGNTLSDNNATGFSAMPAGCNSGAIPSGTTENASFWSSTNYMGAASDAYGCRLYYNQAYVGHGHYPRSQYYSIRCLNDNGIVTTLPTVTTSPCNNVAAASVMCGGNISSSGNASVTYRGVCWSTSQNPTVSDSHTYDGSGAGSFTSSITGLTAGTTYYIRAYATNSVGTAYGNQECITTSSSSSTQLPTVTTSSISNITTFTSTSGGNVISDGGASVIARGVCWSTSQNPTVSGNHTTDGSGTGSFISSITGLTAGTTYYVRAYATNSVGTAYGGQVSFSTLSFTCGTSTVSDYDGNTYNTVQIGSQCWMKENLRTTHYADGTSIPDGGSNMSSETNPYYYNYSIGIALSSRGYLYNWPAVMHGSSSSSTNPSYVQGICPSGWHVPSNAEWTQLTDYVSSQSTYVCGGNNTYIAKALATTSYWGPNGTSTCAINNNQSANNATGFSAVPAGQCLLLVIPTFNWGGEYAFFWSSSQNEYVNASKWGCFLYAGSPIVQKSSHSNDCGLSVRCLKDGGSPQLPTVTTSSVSNITTTSATCGGNVTSDGGATVTARGVCWSTSQNPTVSNSHTTNGSGTGSFSSSITGLTANTTYYIRAYATNSLGTAYGSQVSFTTSSSSSFTCGTSTVSDYDGNTYNTVQIGQQCWMRENLRTTHYANGTSIPAGGSNTSETNPYYYDYSSSGIALSSRGYLYNWPAVMHGSSSSSANPSGVQGICPTGWHVPSDAEWTQLENYVSSQSAYVCGGDNTYIAKALAATSGWGSGSANTCAVANGQELNNATGFSAVPAGYYDGWSSQFAGVDTYFWSSTQGDNIRAWLRHLGCIYAYVGSYSYNKYSGLSVRCLKDMEGSSYTQLPIVTTSSVNNFTTTTATSGGNVTSDGGATVTVRGVCWSTSQNPTVNNSHTTNGSGTGSFSSSITGLTTNTTYYVRAYATNSVGTAYGNQVSFTTSSSFSFTCGTSTVSDYDGNTYNTVQIGQQCWMKQNLRTTHYANGTSILAGGSNTSDTNPYYYDYSSSGIALSSRGYMYNWPAVMNGVSSSSTNPSGVQGICPTGWHVPSDAEWAQLTDYVSSQSAYVCGSDNTYIAKALSSTSGWYSSTNTCAVGNNQSSNNATFFSALPAGVCYGGGGGGNAGSMTTFWSATQSSGQNAYNRELHNCYADMLRGYLNKSCGFYVRCLKD